MIVMSVQILLVGEVCDDYVIFCDFVDWLGFGEVFSEGWDVGQWLCYFYEELRLWVQEEGIVLFLFDDFWQ